MIPQLINNRTGYIFKLWSTQIWALSFLLVLEQAIRVQCGLAIIEMQFRGKSHMTGWAEEGLNRGSNFWAKLLCYQLLNSYKLKHDQILIKVKNTESMIRSRGGIWLFLSMCVLKSRVYMVFTRLLRYLNQ